MSIHEKFNFHSAGELEEKAAALNVNIPLQEDVSILKTPVKIGAFCSPNSLVTHPMECRDGSENGTPLDLTFRRYRRMAEGGSGIIWFEATSVCDEGSSVSNQLMIKNENLSVYSKLVAETKKCASDKNGQKNEPLCVIELTHSGRYSGKKPVIAYHNAYLDEKAKLNSDYPVITDAELERLEDIFVSKAILAVEAGFDLIDVKCCHGYLIGELLSARTREGKYGGSFENRIRFLLEVLDKITDAVCGKAEITVRTGAYDMIPYGWGMKQDGSFETDNEEPIHLLKELYKHGIKIVNLSAGNPYISPCIGRPFDKAMVGDPQAEEHPLVSTARIFDNTARIQQAVPEMKIVGIGYSWLRQYFGMAAAANISQGRVTMAGLGRGSLAYPDFANDLLYKGSLDPGKVCITCSLCSQLMRNGGPAGCMIHDTGIYKTYFDQKCRR